LIIELVTLVARKCILKLIVFSIWCFHYTTHVINIVKPINSMDFVRKLSKID